MKILFADDDMSLRTAMRIILTNAGYEVCEVQNSYDVIRLFEEQKPDLVILDIMMPGIDGFEVCRQLREKSQHVPVLLLSARSDISDKRTGFHIGADDYLTKPFNQEELVLHVEALLRRASLLTPESSQNIAGFNPVKTALDYCDLHIDLDRREVNVAGVSKALTPIEFDILALLAQKPGHVYSRDEIAKQVWGANYSGKEVGIPTHIRHLREKIETDAANPTLIKTVGRFGYRLGD